MSDERRVLGIFEQALDLSVDQRATFLMEACGDDEDLRRNVESLLRTHDGNNDFLPEDPISPPEHLASMSAGFARIVQDGFRNALRRSPVYEPEFPQQVSAGNQPVRLGNYVIVREIGRGGMGVVYEARHQTMRRRVALKVLHPGKSGQGDQLERFLREARAAGRLHHSNIVPVFEVGVDNAVHFYAMQLIQGENLDVVIAEARRLRKLAQEQAPTERPHGTHDAAHCLLSGHFETFAFDEQFEPPFDAGPSGDTTETDGLLPGVEPESDSSTLTHVGDPDDGYYRRIAGIGLQVTEALAYAHDHGILHRDIKPSNLILDRSGTVWVTDFGLATSQGEELTQSGDVVGTLRYMAPERFRGEADERSDLYSFGLTLYELCTLRSAFDQADRAELVRQVTQGEPPPPSQLARSIPKDLETIISRCIAREPSARYADSHKVCTDLRLFLEDRPILARRVSFMEKTWRWCRRNPAVASMLGMVLVLLALVTCGSIAFAWRTQQYNETLIDKTRITTRAESRMRIAYEAEHHALAESKLNLYRALYRQVQAQRQNPLTSRREETLAALTEAAGLLPTLPLTDEEIAEERTALRTEAAALHGQTDVIVDPAKQAGTILTSSVTYNPAFDRYAVSSGFIELRRVGDDARLAQLPQHTYRAVDFEFSSDGRYLAALHRIGVLRPRFVRVWDLNEESPVLDVEISVGLIRLSPVTKHQTHPHLAVVSTESTVSVFPECDVDRRMTRDFGRTVRGADFSSDGRTLFVVGDFPSLEAWTIDDDAGASAPLPRPAASVVCGSELNRVAVGLQSGEIQILDPADTGTPVTVLRGHTNSVHSLSLSPDGTLVASTSWDRSTRLWDVSEEREIKRFENARLRTGFSGDNNHFSCILDDRDVVAYRVVRHDARRVYLDEFGLPRRNDVAIHPTDSRIAVTASSGYVEFWDLRTGRIIEPLKTERAFAARISRDGTRMLTSGRYGLRLWKVDLAGANEAPSVSCTLDHSFTGHDTYGMDCTPDLERVAFVTPDDDVIIADLTQFDQQRRLASGEGLFKVSLSPDGKWLATLTRSAQRIDVWNADTGARIEEFADNQRGTGIAFSPDSSWLAANGTRGRLLWRVADWREVSGTPAVDRFPGDICFSPDGRLIAMPHDRYSLELIDRATFRPVIRLTSTDPRDRATVAFSSDGTQLISTRGTDFEVWDMPELRQKLRQLNIDWEDPEPTDWTPRAEP